MRRIIGGPVFAQHVAQLAPKGYSYARGGYGYQPGRIMSGPYTDIQTTVCLLDGDDGAWFKELLQKATEGKGTFELIEGQLKP